MMRTPVAITYHFEDVVVVFYRIVPGHFNVFITLIGEAGLGADPFGEFMCREQHLPDHLDAVRFAELFLVKTGIS